MRYKYDNLRLDVLPFIPKDIKTVLDIGCGTGKLLKELQNEGKDCYGVEPDKEGAAIAKNNLGSQGIIINKTIEDSLEELPNNYFDVILCLDVLEHLINPEDILNKIKIKLSKSGILISSIPNIRYIHNFYDLVIRKEFEYRDSGVMDKTHLRFFTINSIKKCIKELAI